jgi:hypothetical protein
MANATPSSPGRSEMERVRPEQNIPKGTEVKSVGGKQHLVTEMQNGNERHTRVFPGDYTKDGKPKK